jgi:hypothetical protein
MFLTSPYIDQGITLRIRARGILSAMGIYHSLSGRLTVGDEQRAITHA